MTPASPVASQPASAEPATPSGSNWPLFVPARPAADPAPSWETLPNGALIARVNGYTLVVRRGVKGPFRFVLLAQPPGNRGTTRMASGGRDTAEQAMTAAEQAVAALPDRAF